MSLRQLASIRWLLIVVEYYVPDLMRKCPSDITLQSFAARHAMLQRGSWPLSKHSRSNWWYKAKCCIGHARWTQSASASLKLPA
jgi:hypothetical protein